MALIVEAIFLHSLSMWECHVKFSSIYIPSDFTEVTCSIGTLSMESSSASDRVLNLRLEPINMNSVFVAFKVSLLDISQLLSFSRSGDRLARLNQMQIRTSICNVGVISIHSRYAEQKTVGEINAFQRNTV